MTDDVLFLLFAASSVFAGIATPVLATWAWVRWGFSKRRASRKTRLSLLSLFLGSCALLLCLFEVVYTAHLGGLAFHDHRVQRLYRTGLLIALLGLITGAIGTKDPNPIRWHPPVIGLGAFILWLLATSGA